MLEVLFFSFSISIDAFMYALGFGSKQTKITKKDFLILDLINNIILLLIIKSFYIFYNYFIMYSNFLHIFTSLLLIIFGLYNILNAFLNFKKNDHKLRIEFCNKINYFGLKEFLFLLLIFFLENVFSAFIFVINFLNLSLFLFSNFVFHYLFFLLGFDLGNIIVKKVNIDTSFISGFIFVVLGIVNFL